MKIKCDFDPGTHRVTAQSTVADDFEAQGNHVFATALVQGECYVQDGVAIPVPPRPSPAHQWDWPTKSWVTSLADLRAAAWSRIKAARDAAEFGPFAWGGHTFDGDAVSLSRLSQALEAARFALGTGDTSFVQPWKLADNTWTALTAAQVFEVYRARGQNTLNSHLQAEALRLQIAAAVTAEQLDAITWE